ncbi:MAG: acyl-CoA dehydrogenase, partial [Sphingobacteriales bacterium]|nr:acyl-CoA dehydrogenase [Sphingobacteriales bacterium]
VCLGGSGKANGIAKMVDGGYEITGYWNYATGAAHATVFTANCVIEQEGNTLKDKDGNSIVRSFLFFKEEVTLHKSWNCMGMKGTSSDSFEVKQLFVNNDRAFVIDKAGAILEDAIYQYPFLHFAEVTLAVNICGMAFRFLDLYEELVKERDNTGQSVTRVLSKETALFLEAKKEAFKTSRELFYAAVMYSWEACVGNNGEVFCGLLQTVSQTSRELAANARQLVDELYPYCGLAAANPDNEINRVWRNLHTASQHPLLLY